MNNKPIGVFDSGVGGLTVVKEIKKLLPKEEIIYLGDTARVPYGTRSKETIIKFSYQNAVFLTNKNIKCLIIACNTSSVYAYNYLKKIIHIPVFDVVNPVVDNLSTKSIKKIGIIATKATIRSNIYEKYFRKRNVKVKIYKKACPLFVPIIEEGEIKGDLINRVAARYLSNYKNIDLNALILGCTHYPLIKGVIKKILNNNIKLVNPGYELAKNLKYYLEKSNNLRVIKPSDRYYLTDITDSFLKISSIFLGKNLKNIKKVSIDN